MSPTGVVKLTEPIISPITFTDLSHPGSLPSPGVSYLPSPGVS